MFGLESYSVFPVFHSAKQCTPIIWSAQRRGWAARGSRRPRSGPSSAPSSWPPASRTSWRPTAWRTPSRRRKVSDSLYLVIGESKKAYSWQQNNSHCELSLLAGPPVDWTQAVTTTQYKIPNPKPKPYPDAITAALQPCSGAPLLSPVFNMEIVSSFTPRAAVLVIIMWLLH